MSDASERRTQATELMLAFLERRRRYLWTDAFAVCNLLGLGFVDRALTLVDDVHHDLGRHRKDDHRRGWLSGLPAAEGEEHPTRGGLRIGKPLAERRADEPFDPDLEWERDGQYFHYLTKWMHALDQVSVATHDGKPHAWARELADRAHRAFTYGPTGHKRMVWKLSVDLTRPVVTSMGHHDPLDGLVTCVELDATSRAQGFVPYPHLDKAIADFAEMVDHEGLATTDPLGLGGLLVDASRLARIGGHPALLRAVLAAAAQGLRRWVVEADLRAPADLRLAFRELGLAIGLAAAGGFPELRGFEGLREMIERFWIRPDHRRSATWLEHADINDVMLATALAPEGFVELEGRDRASSTSAARAVLGVRS